MNNFTVKVTGSFVGNFRNYAERESIKPESPYFSVIIEEESDFKEGKLGGVVELIAITLSQIGLDVVKNLIVDYIRDHLVQRKEHAVSWKIKNDQGDELTLQLNKLSIKEIEDLIGEFKGNVTEVVLDGKAG